MSAPPIWMIVPVLLVAGCASGQCPQTGRTGGWLSGWGSGGGSSAFTLGLHRTWRECPDRAATPVKRGPEPVAVPTADPTTEPTPLPSPMETPR